MKELNLKLKGTKQINPIIQVDGKIVKGKYNKFGNYEGKIDIQKDIVDVKIFRYLEINGKFWFLLSIFYFLISIFGIFDTMKEKTCIVLDCYFKLNTKDVNNANLELIAGEFQTQGKAFKIQCDCEVKEVSNNYYFDKKAKTKKKWLNCTKFLIFVCFVVGLAFLIKNILGF